MLPWFDLLTPHATFDISPNVWFESSIVYFNFEDIFASELSIV